ncbi:MAG: phosphomannomutase CpsG [Myxococcales bacterium]|nr:phosphomannomutase CpsG [Myxococcales bacterium]
MGDKIACFKAYDIRGRIPDQLNEDMAEKIGRAYAEVVGPKKVVVGHDVRLSSEGLTASLAAGLNKAGVDVVHIGMCGTEEIYFATSHLGVDGGIMVTASHNPMDYNGMKLVREESKPISGDTGLKDIEALVAAGKFSDAAERGSLSQTSTREAYIEHLLGYVDVDKLKPLKLVSNPGNGCAGPVAEALAEKLPFEIIELYHDPDGNFPNGIPNPLLPENRPATAKKVKETGADMGIAWDGDFDRCFLFDENGGFIEGYYIVGLLGEQLLRNEPGGKVIYDPRLTWNTIELVQAAGGKPVLCKSGHAFIKERMRKENAVYGGEMSAHHYFRDFFYCDSGMVPWLLVAQAMSVSGKKLSELVGERIKAFPASGEINRRVDDADAAIAAVRESFADGAVNIETVDGLSIEHAEWRLNVRKSNTEPLLRLNVESRGDEGLMKEKTEAILGLLAKMGAVPA